MLIAVPAAVVAVSEPARSDAYTPASAQKLAVTKSSTVGDTRAAISALSSWKGSIIFVSHDTEFVEQLQPTKVLLMPDGQVDYFTNDWLDLVELA